MLRFEYKPGCPDYTNPKQIAVALEFSEMTGDENIEDILLMFKEFLYTMSFDSELIDRIQYHKSESEQD